MRNVILILLFLSLLAKGKGKKMDGLNNNNPFNIKDDGTKWQGMVGTADVHDGTGGKYVKFATMAYGVRAGMKNAINSAFKYPTFNEFFRHYVGGAPGWQNYAEFVANACGTTPEQKIVFPDMLFNFLKAQINFENSNAANKGLVTNLDISNGINLA